MLDFLEITKTKIDNRNLEKSESDLWKDWKWQVENTVNSIEDIENI